MYDPSTRDLTGINVKLIEAIGRSLNFFLTHDPFNQTTFNGIHEETIERLSNNADFCIAAITIHLFNDYELASTSNTFVNQVRK